MSNLPHARNFRDLLAYQKPRQLAREIFLLSRSFPREDLFSLTDQIRRSSRSIGAQIAEAWAKRRYEKSFISKLTDADGEQHETQHWVSTAAECGYLSEAQAISLIEKCKEIGRLLSGMMSKSELSCGEPTNSIREPVSDYFIGDER